MLYRPYFDNLFIFCLGLVLFTIGLSHQEITGFESRFYLFALEMWRHGVSLFPTTYAQPYPDYPVTSTLLIYLCALCAGGLSKGIAVLPSALAAALTLTLTYQIGALRNPRWGMAAVCLLLLTQLFVAEARTISLDQYITCVTTGCFYLAYSADVLHKPHRLRWLPLLFIAGFAIRGPIGVIIPAGVLFVFYLLDKRMKNVAMLSLVAGSVLVACSLAILGMAYVAGGSTFLHDVLQMEVLGRIHSVRTPPYYFYFVESLGAYAVTYPLALLVLVGLGRLFITARSDDMTFIKKCVGWALVILLGLTVPQDKKMRYVLAISPALSLIAAYLFVAPRAPGLLSQVRRIFCAFCFFLPMMCLAALWIFSHAHPMPALVLQNQRVVSLLVILQGAFCAAWLGIQQIERREMMLLVGAVATFFVMYLIVIEPINLFFNRTHVFVQSVEAKRIAQHAHLVFYREGSDAMPIKYVAHMSQEEMPVFLSSFEALKAYQARAFFITDKEHFADVMQAAPHVYQVIQEGRIGHDNFVIFTQA